MLKKFTLLTFLFLLVNATFSQQGQGSINGTVLDKESGEGVPFANVKILQNGNIKGGATTDFDGKFTISSLTPGSYDIEVNSVGYKPLRSEGVIVSANKISFPKFYLETGNELEEVEVIAYQVPLIDKDGGSSGGTITREDIAKLPGRSAASIASTVGGVGVDANGGIASVRGARSDATYYYIDGIKVRGSSGLPKAAIQEVSVMTGGIPANYGDATGGIISVTTRGPSSFYFGGIDYLTSGYKIGDDTYGLDRNAYNLLEGSISGPLFSKKDSTGAKTPILGFFLAVNVTSITNPRPFATPQYKLKDSVRDALLDPNQLGMITILGGDQNRVLYNTDFLTSNSFEKVKFSPNVPNKGASASLKIDVNLGPNIVLAFGGSMQYNRSKVYSGWASTLFNYDNNPVSTSLDYRGWGRFTQRFENPKDEEGNERSGGVKNVYYSLMIDYSKSYGRTEDESLKDDFFKYGYIGKFERNFYKVYPYNQALGMFEMSGYGSLLRFVPDSLTENAAASLIAQQVANYVAFDPRESYLSQLNITNQYTNTLAGQNYWFDELDYRTNQGLLNGQQPNSVYSMWTNFGTQYNGYSIGDNTQIRFTGAGSASVGNHAIQLGFEFERRDDRFYSISPVGLWQLMRLQANSHIEDADRSNPIYYFGEQATPYVDYNRLNTSVGDYFGYDDPQSHFDYYLRQALGLDPDGIDYLNTDEYDPSIYSIDMFSPDELFNNGGSYVSYAGYDYTGKRLKGQQSTSYNDFFNKKNDEGDYVRTIPGFQPIYMSGYIMDKFAFDDLIFNVGLRVDRFDANQPVLKDKYLFMPANTVADLKNMNTSSLNGADNIPTNLSDNAVVYVDNAFNPTSITGYRDGDIWYNANGVQVSDYRQANSGPVANPYLREDIGQDQKGVHFDALKDYDPRFIVMPRIAFSFPISDEALFFAHYDILAQRPSGLQFPALSYLYASNLSSGSTLANPDLSPEKTIDYELGFQQVLSKTSSLKISSFYREQRDYITVVNVFGAYPTNYSTFTNLDFGTVKGLTFTYDLRRTGNVRFNASYTLQFADGTGSSSGSGLNFLRAGIPNFRSISPYSYDQRHAFSGSIDYRYGEGKDYNGPVIAGKQVFKNTGANFAFNFGSGTPYSLQTNFTNTATGQGSGQFSGTINGSRKPWQYRFDAQFDKNITLKFGSEDSPKLTNLNIYLQINNIFNIVNVVNIYEATGNPDDDGFLSSAQGVSLLNSQPAPEAYQNYYNLKMSNPYNYSIPRTIRLGVKFDF